MGPIWYIFNKLMSFHLGSLDVAPVVVNRTVGLGLIDWGFLCVMRWNWEALKHLDLITSNYHLFKLMQNTLLLLIKIHVISYKGSGVINNDG